MEQKKINLDELDTTRGAEQGFELELVSPRGKALPGRLRIRGYDSSTYQEKVDEQQRARLQRTSATQKIPELAELEAETIELAAVLIMGWTCNFELGGQPLPYSPANAQTLLRRFKWIRQQVDRAAANRANFLPGPSAS